MKFLYSCMVALSLFGWCQPAWAYLRSFGEIVAVGCRDTDPSQLVIVLHGGQWGGAVSSDGGKTWLGKEEYWSPPALQPLPRDGTIQFLCIEKNLLLKSTDAGRSWINISPWPALRKELADNIEKWKRRFYLDYGKWLPEDEAWPLVFGASGLLYCVCGVLVCRRSQEAWVVPVITSIAGYALIGTALFAVHSYVIWIFRIQWQDQHTQGAPTHYPLWPAGVALHLMGNAWIAPLTAAFCFPAVPLFYQSVGSDSSSRSGRPITGLGMVLVVAFVAFLGVGIRFGTGWE